MRCALSLLTFCLTFATSGFSSTSTSLGVASSSLYNPPQDPNTNTETIQRVRIPVTLKSWKEVDTKAPDGSFRKSRIASRPVSQVLRARIERANDFYLGDWRLQTTPVRWLKRSNQYQVRLELFRRYGEAGQLEESLGSVTLTGSLEKQDDSLYVLHGTARRLFRDRTGDPLLDLEAGHHDAKNGTAMSKLDK